MDVSRVQIGSFVDDLYSAAIGDREWHGVLNRLTELVAGEFATFEFMDMRAGGYADFHASAAPDVNQSYLEYYAQINPRLDGVINNPDLLLISDYDFLSEQEMERDEFYNDFLAPHGLRYCAGVRAFHTPELIGTFSIQRTERQGHVTESELGVLGELRPHMCRAAQIYLRLGKLAADVGLLQSLLSHKGRGLIIVDKFDKVTFMNDTAETICRRGDGFGRNRREFSVRHKEAQKALSQAIDSIRKTGSTKPAQARRFTVPRGEGSLPYIATISSIPPNSEMQFDMSGGAVIVTIDDPTLSHQPSHEILMSLFGLSQAESEVACAVAGGLTVRRIAENRGVTIATVRSQIQSILQKTQLRRQSDLVRLLAGLA